MAEALLRRTRRLAIGCEGFDMTNQLGAGGLIENRTFDEIAVGDAASLTRIVSQQDIDLAAVVSGDGGLTGAAAKASVNGLIATALVCNAVETVLPGPGAVCLGQSMSFLGPVRVGDVVTATLTATAKDAASGEVTLDCRCANAAGEVVAAGTVRVRAPSEKLRLPRPEATEIRFNRHERFRALMAQAKGHQPMATAIAHPCDASAVGAAVEAAQAGLIAPILVGPEAKIRKAAEAAGVDISPYRLVDAPHSEAAAAAAVDLVRKGEAALLMKGSLHTDELLHAVLAPDSGLRTGRRLSHVYLMDVPAYPRPLLVTDAAVNIAPDLEAKRDIVQNAIDLAHVLGVATPRVAILAAVEVVNPEMRSTLDAAALCKMADRGQITGALLDGPLAFDNAISLEAAAEKGIVSQVAGQADILVVPDLEAGNMLAKQLSFMAGADAAGVVLGARVPIILTSRADSERARLASCAVAVLIAQARAAAAI
jgi:phosphate butyryltransferase